MFTIEHHIDIGSSRVKIRLNHYLPLQVVQAIL